MVNIQLLENALVPPWIVVLSFCVVEGTWDNAHQTETHRRF